MSTTACLLSDLYLLNPQLTTWWEIENTRARILHTIATDPFIDAVSHVATIYLLEGPTVDNVNALQRNTRVRDGQRWQMPHMTSKFLQALPVPLRAEYERILPRQQQQQQQARAAEARGGDRKKRKQGSVIVIDHTDDDGDENVVTKPLPPTPPANLLTGEEEEENDDAAPNRKKRIRLEATEEFLDDDGDAIMDIPEAAAVAKHRKLELNPHNPQEYIDYPLTLDWKWKDYGTFVPPTLNHTDVTIGWGEDHPIDLLTNTFDPDIPLLEMDDKHVVPLIVLDALGLDIGKELGQGVYGKVSACSVWHSGPGVFVIKTGRVKPLEFTIAKRMGELGVGPRIWQWMSLPSLRLASVKDGYGPSSLVKFKAKMHSVRPAMMMTGTGVFDKLPAILIDRLDMTLIDWLESYQLSAKISIVQSIDASIRLARLVEQMHKTGVHHNDLHLNNILVKLFALPSRVISQFYINDFGLANYYESVDTGGVVTLVVAGKFLMDWVHLFKNHGSIDRSVHSDFESALIIVPVLSVMARAQWLSYKVFDVYKGLYDQTVYVSDVLKRQKELMESDDNEATPEHLELWKLQLSQKVWDRIALATQWLIADGDYYQKDIEQAMDYVRTGKPALVFPK